MIGGKDGGKITNGCQQTAEWIRCDLILGTLLNNLKNIFKNFDNNVARLYCQR